MRVFVVALYLSFSISFIEAQRQPAKFGEVSMEELTMRNYRTDSSAVAVILFDKGHSVITLGSTSLVTYKRHIRIKIFKKEGFEEWANEKLVLERGSFSKLRGTTYNLEKDKIVESKLDENSIFKTRFNKYTDEIKFTLPNVKEGSVIEYSYVLRGDGLRGWQFQHAIPTLWSEYAVDVPRDFTYRVYKKGLLSPKSRDKNGNHEKWVFANIPAFKPELYMPNPDDYISKINFSFSKSSWSVITIGLIADENFGRTIKEFPFLQKQVDELTYGITDPREKIMAICTYIKENLEWNGTRDIYADDLKSVFKLKKGTAADLNLALASMLHKAGIPVDMVLLSTRGNGFVDTDLPTLRQFNYVVCLPYIDSVGILLDATEKYLPWNVLPERCLNGKGLIISETNYGWAEVVSKVKAKTVASAEVIINAQGEVSGKLTYTRDGYAAFDMRTAFQKDGKESYLKDLLKDNAWKVSKSEFRDMDDIGKSVKEIHEITIEEHGTLAGDFIYVNPFVVFNQEQNPFKAETREFPIDFGTIFEKVYLCSITIPDGYIVDEVPQPKLMVLPENAAKFAYNITQVANRLMVVSNIQINQRVFMQEQYPNLRELYSRIVAKHAEQIVLKKK